MLRLQAQAIYNFTGIGAALGLALLVYRAASGVIAASVFIGTAIAACLAVRLVFRLLEADLQRRIEATSPPQHVAQDEGCPRVLVADQVLATIEREALHDPRAAIGQVLEVGRASLTLVGRILRVIPSFAFWGTIVLAVLDPAAFQVVVEAVQAAPRRALLQLLNLVTVMSVVIVLLSVLVGTPWVIKNHHTARTHRMLRRYCEEPRGAGGAGVSAAHVAE